MVKYRCVIIYKEFAMLKLTNIVKEYKTGDSSVVALKGVDLEFRKSEFVSILGHSGCGKTTLLNIIGGLDRYTSGDLTINGRSTTEFKARDWDNYRNHSIGFVFQSYNLIPHQTVLSNVELALTLSGVSKAERKARAKEALEKVGLGDQLKKKPTQMSGGQMQRVAIARALVNDPDILLADEPTGALDTETSKQIMEILQEISKNKLVIMVTHNPELADIYSSRIIKLVDGKVVDDSAPYTKEEPVSDAAPEVKRKKAKRLKKRSMSFLTALSLSLNNLMTKKARTILTSFAGSIGIIGIALILALSNGIQIYIDQVQEETLSSYPITIEAESVDMSAMITTLMGTNAEKTDHKLDKVYSSPVLNELINSMTNATITENNLKPFKEYLDNADPELAELISALDYSYAFDFNVFFKDSEGKISKSDAMELMQETMGMSMDMTGVNNLAGGMNRIEIYEEMLSGENGALINDLLYDQYDCISGNWPKTYDEIVLVVDQNNEVSDFALLALGLTTLEEAKESWNKIEQGAELDTAIKSWSYEEIRNMTFSLVPSYLYYAYDKNTNTYHDISSSDAGLAYMYDNGIKLKISGIIRPKEDATASMLMGTIGYTKALTDKVIEMTNSSDIAKAQLNDPKTDVILGLPFATEDDVEPSDTEKANAFTEYIAGLTDPEKVELFKAIASTPDPEFIKQTVDAQMQQMTREYIETVMVEEYAAQSGIDKETLQQYLAEMSDEELYAQVEKMITEATSAAYTEETLSQLNALPEAALITQFNGYFAQLGEVSEENAAEYAELYDAHMPPTTSESNYEEVLSALGIVSKDSPSSINIYASTFEAKDEIAAAIEEYNSKVSEDDRITYTDYVAMMMSSVTIIINVISYVLIAFVAISLVVSSIMIGIITYISVLERTKEIGILRAIGASKKDISRVFNAETLIVGFVAGAFGIGLTLLLCWPVNLIIRGLSGIENIGAQLPVVGAVVLVIISMLLTFIAGLIPSGVAAKKDPVEALRSE